MRLRLSVLATVGSVTLLSFATACSSTDNQTPDNTGGTSSAGKSAGGSGGVGASGGSTSAGGTSGMGAAGASAGHNSGGSSGAGVSGSGGSGGQATAGASPGGSSSAAGSAAYPPVTDQTPTWDNVKLVLTGTNPPCGSADCHGAGGPNIFQLDTSSDANLYMDLTTHISMECGNIPVVTPGDVSKSALAKVLTTGCSANVPRMPKGCTPGLPSDGGNCVPDDYIGAVVGWIAAGAPH